MGIIEWAIAGGVGLGLVVLGRNQQVFGDTQPPVVVIKTPENNTIVDVEGISIEVQVTDNVEVSKVEIAATTPDGSRGTGFMPLDFDVTTNTYRGVIQAGADENTMLTVRATDTNNNTGFGSVIVKYVAPDITAPKVLIASPPANQNYPFDTKLITITGSASDNIGGVGIDRVEASVDGNQFVRLTVDNFGQWSGQLDIGSSGSHTFAVRAVDKAGNMSDVVGRSIMIASPPPPPALTEVKYSSIQSVDTKIAMASMTRYIFQAGSKISATIVTPGRLFEAIGKKNIEVISPKITSGKAGVKGVYFQDCDGVKVLDTLGDADIDLVKGGGTTDAEKSACVEFNNTINFTLDGGKYHDASRGINARANGFRDGARLDGKAVMRNFEAFNTSVEGAIGNGYKDLLVEKFKCHDCAENPLDIGFNDKSIVRDGEIWGAGAQASGIHYDSTKNNITARVKLRSCVKEALGVNKAQNCDLFDLDIAGDAVGVAISGSGTVGGKVSNNIDLHDCTIITGGAPVYIQANQGQVRIWNLDTGGKALVIQQPNPYVKVLSAPPSDYVRPVV